MNTSKLSKTLISLTDSEWSSFRKYLLSKTGKDSDNFEFFEFLQARKGRLDKLEDQEIVRARFFPKFSSKGFLNMMSRIFNWLEEWIAIEVLKNSNYDADLNLIKYFNSKGLFKLADQTAKRLEKRIKTNLETDTESAKALYTLYHNQYYSDNPVKKTTDQDLLKDLVTTHHHWVKQQNILYITELINRSLIRNINYDEIIQLCTELINTLPDSSLSKQIEHLIDLVSKNDLNALIKLKCLLEANALKTQSELHTLVTMYSITFALKLWVKGIHKDKHLVSDLYEYGLKNKVLMSSGRIPVVRFHNMISTLSVVQSFEWMKNFINNWYLHVDSLHHESTLRLANAQNAFYHDKYDLILIELRSIEFENIIQKTRALGLELVAFYYDKDLREELLLSSIRNFHRFLKRNKNKLSTYYSESHYNLSLIISELYKRIYTSGIKININDYNPLIYRNWVEKEINKE